ncbi:MAG: class I SAM-dependent methyltransferase [Peptococcaceae bacterium]
MEIDVTEEIKSKYNEKAESYDKMLAPMEKMMMGKWRKILFAKAEGLILEAGAGTGANIPYYPEKAVKVIGIDFSPKMLEKAKEKLSLAKVSVELMEGDVQHLPFKDSYFDTVVAACVFCSVPDPVQGFKELRRVIKPEGELYMLEHVRSEGKFLGLLMDKLNPLSLKYGGVNINRRTENNIRLAGLKVTSVELLFKDIVKLITVSPNK